MSSDTASWNETTQEVKDEGFEQYRAVHKAAVVSVVLGVASLTGWYFSTMLVLAAVGLVLGVIAYRSIVRYPQEFVGKPLAMIGTLGCAVILIAGTSKHSYEYATEVPEGYQRISFAELQPDPNHPELPVPPKALELDGQRVFVKGYFYPDGQQFNIQRFVLVPDMGTCCFGGQPKLTDMIEVSLTDPLRGEYSRRKRGLAGVLKVDQRLKPISGLNGVYYQLTADHLK